MRALFSEADLEAIRKATAAAESQTSGEIVPYIVERVIDHDEARWRGATIGALAAALSTGLVETFGNYWGGLGFWWIVLPAVAGAGFGYLLAGIETIERFFIARDHLEREARLRAEAAFLQEAVFETRDRTGVLIFLALFEHQAVILADEGIHQSVPAAEWENLVEELVAGIRAGRAAEAMCEVIDRCGKLLQHYQVNRRQDDQDELSDAARIRER